MSQIHPTALISPSAQIDDTAIIGPYCIVGDEVSIGAHTVLHRHVVVTKLTRIGKHNQFYQFSSIGEDCQDLKYAGERTWLEIGDHNTIREACSLHRGTAQDDGLTKIGSHNLLMVNTHVAHDCVIGDHNVLANNVGVAGHVTIGNHTIIGGNSGIHQFCTVDDYSLIGGASLILKDVAAFTMVSGNPATTHGLNIEGMRRKDWSKETIDVLRQAYRTIFRSGMTTTQALIILQEDLLYKEPKIQMLIDSLQNSKRGVVR
ncbi:acyl-ACP--UDP-N-acetylglucosamine O-acyltransferase [Psychrobacter sp. AOP22-C1-22]|uniref:acyl-ACP--UDP-N-acetylglucosamine O-acyltransferase n=1 Tax=unclassified Psychrobacter TaxID=196806 RepID=UPI001787EC62|nr:MULTISPECIES: acyl-ACP--UDP-N-acetylglucosamine O-acyltransferase [unclassified Psychrobacter]MBE0406245.1 acyl-ACP--UDP-N-acetylglucosamine O-acyltransferase [Psychrobacter sp. FME6]MBE0444624.1 acyl-ACP--UDP-N-acetylglucosamine O-acyltransferase [Psychrobacter sp. FME5]MDN5801115.1 acyl-ACP--UDP-N-acetylglucosamine O-acyltransferase [Psychrobacter sp.]MDN5892051.1 acyl-ACP--UDP-N-acetylglucosamine O-acyltransferase [Psychrobacter sp.]